MSEGALNITLRLLSDAKQRQLRGRKAKISPSEAKGLGLGLKLLTYDGKHKRTEAIDGKLVRTKVYARFESPPIDKDGTIVLGAGTSGWRRHVLHSYSKSRAGAWKHAVRWLRQLQAGKL